MAYSLSGNDLIDDPAILKWIKDVKAWEKKRPEYSTEALEELSELQKAFPPVWGEYQNRGGPAKLVLANVGDYYDLENTADVTTSEIKSEEVLLSIDIKRRELLIELHTWDDPWHKSRYPLTVEQTVE